MDFTSYYFDTLRLRNELLARLGTYLSMPAKLDALDRMVTLLLKSKDLAVAATAARLKDTITRSRKSVEDQIANTQKLSNDILAFKDSIEANPELNAVLTGQTSVGTFAINTLLNSKTAVYKPYFEKAFEFSKAALAAVKDLENLSTIMTRLEADVNGTYNASVGRGVVPTLAEAAAENAGLIFGLSKPVAIGVGVVITGVLAIISKKGKR